MRNLVLIVFVCFSFFSFGSVQFRDSQSLVYKLFTSELKQKDNWEGLNKNIKFIEDELNIHLNVLIVSSFEQSEIDEMLYMQSKNQNEEFLFVVETNKNLIHVFPSFKSVDEQLVDKYYELIKGKDLIPIHRIHPYSDSELVHELNVGIYSLKELYELNDEVRFTEKEKYLMFVMISSFFILLLLVRRFTKGYLKAFLGLLFCLVFAWVFYEYFIPVIVGSVIFAAFLLYTKLSFANYREIRSKI